MKQGTLDFFVKRLPKKQPEASSSQEIQVEHSDALAANKENQKKRSPPPKPSPPTKKKRKLVVESDYEDELPKSTAVSPPKLKLKTGEDRKKERQQKFTQANESKYAFLNDIRDAERRRSDDPLYDPRTLYIPKDFWAKATPFEKQYWEIKCKHFDTVVFFKKGKFFELFERDADLGAKLFDLKLTDRGHMRMVGVPESGFEFWAGKFIGRGYKVAKVDQLESALGKEMRERDGKKGQKEDNIVRRELTAVLTAGTLVDTHMVTGDQSTYCLSIKERELSTHLNQGSTASVRFGVCLVDTSTAQFYMCSFEDDRERSMLETVLVRMKPKEVIVEKGHVSARTLKMLKEVMPPNSVWNSLVPTKEFWDSERCRDELLKYDGFTDDQRPDAISKMHADDDAMSALGALLWYLRSLKLDSDLVSLGNFSVYDPMKAAGTLILDGQSLINLEVLTTSDGSDKGSLLSLLNRCTTPFGKRLFKRWVCHPLCSKDAIEDRLNAVEDLQAISDVADQLIQGLKRIPDLERQISRIHAGSCKLKDFMAVLDGFDTLQSAISKLTPSVDEFKSDRLRRLVKQFPTEAIKEKLELIHGSFDLAKAKSQGEFVVKRGAESDFDALTDEVREIEQGFEKHLIEQKRALGCSDLKYKDLGKEIFQIEVPNKAVPKVPANWAKRSGTKACARYHSPFLIGHVRKFQEAQERMNVLLGQLFARVLVKFDASYHSVWKPAVEIVAELDALMSLSRVSFSALGELACRPEFVESDGQRPVFDVKGLKHPCVSLFSAKDFIPNDIQMGGDVAELILLTGPNMGGKSTLLRQTCIAIIMAQLGCYVPAESCRMTLFDRIFTRIGANDNILAGQSTFMVELAETAKILHEATPQSLVILDELGRGTSTFDGYAIAFSVLSYLASRSRCLGLFSTHYALLTSEFQKCAGVRCMFMNCQVDQNERDVVFLYKLIDGVSPKSYGMNVAGMAGVPLNVIETAEKKASEMVGEKGWIGTVGYRAAEAMEVDQGDHCTLAVDSRKSRALNLLVQSQVAHLTAKSKSGSMDELRNLIRQLKCH